MTIACVKHGQNAEATVYTRGESGLQRIRCKQCHADKERQRRAKARN